MGAGNRKLCRKDPLKPVEEIYADSEKKMADLVKKEADKTKRIGDTLRSITKNTSASMLKSKSRQIEGYQKELARVLSDKATINKKIADKRMRLSAGTVKLQKEESAQAKSLAKQQEKVYATYEQQIADLLNK